MRRQKRRSQKKWKRLTRHHNRAKSRGGSFDRKNIYLLTADHHQAFHKLFGNRTFAEAAKVLIRLQILHKQWDDAK